MAGLPGVTIVIGNGGLGRTAQTNDGIVGLILTGAAISAGGGVTGIALYEPKSLFSLKDAETLGITATATADANKAAWAQIRDFYQEAGEGALLWIMLKAAADTQAQMLDHLNGTNTAKKLIDASQGTIRVLFSSNWQAASFSPTLAYGLHDDVQNALARGQDLGNFYAGQQKPLRVLVDGRDFNGTVTDLIDLHSYPFNRCGVCLAGNSASGPGGKHAAMGLLAGRVAPNPVMRNIGRVEDGPVLVTGATLTSGSALSAWTDAQLATAHDRGYIVFRRHVRRAGFYYNDDPMATANTDDFYSLANGRVIDKAAILAHDTYLANLLSEVPVQADGKIPAGLVKTWQQQIENALRLQMTQKGEVSGATCTIDPNQNILATDTIEAVLRVTPVGTLRKMTVKLGLFNPATA